MLSRPCRIRRPSSRDDGVVSWFFSSCMSSLVFFTRYDGEFREPLVWRQESQVSMHVCSNLLCSNGKLIVLVQIFNII